MPERPRVLEILFGNTLGGAEVLLRELIRVADTERFEWHVCLLRRRVAFEQFADLDAEFTLHHVPCGRGVDPRCIRRLARLMRQIAPQVVHTHGFRTDLHGRWAAHRAGVPVILTTIHALRTVHSETIRTLLDRLTLRWADRVIGCTQTITDFTAKRLRLPPGRVATIANGTPTAPFLEARDSPALRGSLGIGPDDRVIGTVGRLCREKNQSDFLRMAREVLDQHPDTRFLIVGDGPMRARLERLAADLGVGERVVFTGPRSDVPDLMSMMSCFVLCSLWEAMPITILEAMAAAVPCVSVDVGGCRDVVEPGKTGWLVTPRDPHALASAVDEVLAQPGRAAEVAGRARALVLEHHTIERCARAHEDLFIRLLREKGITGL